ncbi:MAG: hypothetical protein IJZ37_04890, partial [Clostridia bacterium]|nr:hypothetical protein [Clostridia bacterium]
AGKLMIDGRIPTEVEEDTLTVAVSKADGTQVTSYTVKGEGELRSFSVEATGITAGETYIFTLKNEKGVPVTCAYILTVK